MRCGGRDIDVENLRPDRITLDVRRGGARLIGNGSLEGQKQRLTLDAEGEDRYTGKVKARVRGAKTTITYAWQVVSPEVMVGTVRSKVKARGLDCTIARDFEARWQGPS